MHLPCEVCIFIVAMVLCCCVLSAYSLFAIFVIHGKLKMKLETKLYCIESQSKNCIALRVP